MSGTVSPAAFDRFVFEKDIGAQPRVVRQRERAVAESAGFVQRAEPDRSPYCRKVATRGFGSVPREFVVPGNRRRQFRCPIRIEFFEHACDPAMARARAFRRHGLSNRLVDDVVRKRVFEKPAPARFAHDAPVEKFVECVPERGFVPSAHLAKRVVRKSNADASGDLCGRVRLVRELADTAGHEGMQIRGWIDAFALSKVVDKLRQEERVPVGNGQQRGGREIGDVGHRFGQFVQIVER